METKKLYLSSYQLKWIALVFMTIDHLAMIVELIPVIASCATLLRLLGRIAAPLFLFVLTESIRYTRSKSKLILRLYIAGVSTGLFTLITNLIFGKILFFSPGNIFFTYFYTAVYIYFVENMIKAINEQNVKKTIIFTAGIFSTIVPQLLCWWFDALKISTAGIKWKIVLRDILNSIIPPTLYIEYSLLFVIMGVLLYFVKERRLQYIVFLCFCALSFFGASINRDLWPFNDFFESQQCWMVLAMPIMLLYNGKEGKSHKGFFYVYYPVHRYLISLLATLIGMQL